MIYELRITTFFQSQSAMADVMDKLNDAKSDMIVVNPGQPNQQCSVIESLDCFHDTQPHRPCILTSHWDNCP